LAANREARQGDVDLSNGWQLYFDGDQLTDVIVAGHSPME